MASYIKSSIGRKQIVAVTGLLLVLYLVFHLSMNLLFFAGADVYNFFPDMAHATGVFLRLIEASLAVLFFTHIGFTIALVIENKKARRNGYAVTKSVGKRSLATRLMPITGTILLTFLIVHLLDFTFAEHHGAVATVAGEDLGLFGLVFNSFASLIRTSGYVIAMFAVGFHLAHGVQSVCQSYGFHSEKATPIIQKVSTGIGLFFAIAFSSVPIYAYVMSTCLPK